jgi:ubiquinone biosynthesis protein
METLRLLGRAVQIGLLITVHGLLVLLRYLGLRLRRAAPAERHALLGRALVRLARTLGATFIKIGQFLSTRGDLVPAATQEVLRQLQDRVGPFAWADVRATLVVELAQTPEQAFREVDPYPVASASVAQVHRGLLHDGRTVAIKVLRPGIERTVRFDLGVLRLAARLIALVPGLRRADPVGVVDEFGAAVAKQLDFRIEAANNRQLAANFAGEPSVKVPSLVEPLCTRRVLVMEFVEGTKILEIGADDPRRAELARTGLRMLLKMIFVDGLVHADLHPGNLIVQGDRLYLLDLGLVATLTPTRRQGLVRILSAWAAGDGARVAEAVLAVAPVDTPPADPARFQREVVDLVERYRRVSLAEVQLGLVLLELARLLRRQRVRLEASLTMVLIAIGVVEGVGRTLAPTLDLAREALGFFARIRTATDATA